MGAQTEQAKIKIGISAEKSKIRTLWSGEKNKRRKRFFWRHVGKFFWE